MDKSLGTLLHFWGIFQFTQVQPLPSPHKKCWTSVSRIFSQVSTLYRVGGERTARKFRKRCTVLWGNQEMTEKYEYCSTVPRTFVHDCRLTLNFQCLLAIEDKGNWESTQVKKILTWNQIQPVTCIHIILWWSLLFH